MSKRNKRIIIVGIIIVALFLILGAIYIISPKIELNGKKVINLIYPQKYEEEGYKINSFLKGYEKNVTINSNVDDTKLGTYKVEYTIPFLIFKISTIRIVNIVDKTPPVLTLEGDKQITICPNATYNEQGYNAVDDYDGDITINVKSAKVSDGIIYDVSDSSNNQSQEKRIINEKDETSPTISINGANPKYVIIGTPYEEEGANASDNCEENISDKITIEGSVDINKIGSYEIKYKVEDSSGNVSETTRTVKVINKTDNSNSTIYLTFDDGPSSNITPKILDILKEENIHATFFVINRDDSLNYLIKRAFDEGHTIGLHTASHNYAKIYTSENAFFEDLNIIREKVKNITGKYSNIIRFPGGTSNTVSRSYNRGIMTRLSKEVLNRGFYYFDWNISSGDAGGVYSNWDVYNNVINGLSNRKTNVVLMHDSSDKTYTLNALRDIIKYGKEKGFSFDRITESTQPIRHNPQN